MLKKIFLPTLLLVVLIFISFSGNFFTDMGALHTDKKIKSKIFNDLKSKYVFVFFGYVGCRDVCTPRLQELSDIYTQLKKNNIDIETVFVSLLKEDKETVNRFATYFHNEFHGISLDKKVLQKVKNEFSVYNFPSLSQDGEYNHTSFLFLLKKTKGNEYNLIRTYTSSPFNKDAIIKDIKNENLQ